MQDGNINNLIERAGSRDPDAFAELIRILIRKCYDIRKQNAGRVDPEEVEEPAAQDDNNLELWEAMNALGETYSIVLTLYYGLGYRGKEIAKMLNISPGAVRVRLKRGRQKLKEYYENS